MDILRPGSPQRKKLDATQAAIAAAYDEIEQTVRSDASDDDLMQHCRRAVQDELTELRARQFDDFRRSDALIDRLDFPGMARLQNAKLPALTWSALICLFGADLVTQMIFDAAKRGATNPPGLPNAELAKAVAALREQARKLERDEEREILKLEGAGFSVLRREDIDPATVFSVWETYTEQTEAAA